MRRDVQFAFADIVRPAVGKADENSVDARGGGKRAVFTRFDSFAVEPDVFHSVFQIRFHNARNGRVGAVRTGKLKGVDQRRLFDAALKFLRRLDNVRRRLSVGNGRTPLTEWRNIDRL